MVFKCVKVAFDFWFLPNHTALKKQPHFGYRHVQTPAHKQLNTDVYCVRREGSVAQYTPTALIHPRLMIHLIWMMSNVNVWAYLCPSVTWLPVRAASFNSCLHPLNRKHLDHITVTALQSEVSLKTTSELLFYKHAEPERQTNKLTNILLVFVLHYSAREICHSKHSYNEFLHQQTGAVLLKVSVIFKLKKKGPKNMFNQRKTSHHMPAYCI